MGTNFYLHRPSESRCLTCGHDPQNKPLHIGKSSFGWRFSLHIIPEENIMNLDDWKREWDKDGAYIENEYKDKITPEAMLAIITERGDGRYCRKGVELMRHEPDGRHCLGCGEGTYDYIVGEFS